MMTRRILVLAVLASAAPVVMPTSETRGQPTASGLVKCANLVYGEAKTSVCFSAEFLSQLTRETHILTEGKFASIQLETAELFVYPFAIMSGEDTFELTAQQRDNLRSYLTGGGFLVASAGCSDDEWAESFRREIQHVFPELQLKPIDPSHPIFHTVYDIDRLDCKRGDTTQLEALEMDGKIVLVFSPDGLNDTGQAGGKCCCCGGNEILNSRQINVNLLAYTLTH
ncbi:MAG: DUF4159 domain-containing protein [Planctomycetota bacterium]|nr:DUF4159 domain-containing protein [Planctomycetota bacterium]MDA1177357.1 DUF4159 domain-containing protein [Planctomycetota bacterium]